MATEPTLLKKRKLEEGTGKGHRRTKRYIK